MIGESNRLLIVDDESGVSNFLALVAERLGFKVNMAANKGEFVTKLYEFKPTALVLDMNLPDTDGTELLRHLADKNSPTQIFLISGGDLRAMIAAEHLGVLLGLRMAGILQKPLMLADLEEAFGRVMDIPLSDPMSIDEPETGIYQQFDAGEFHRVQKALAKAEAAYIAASEPGTECPVRRNESQH